MDLEEENVRNEGGIKDRAINRQSSISMIEWGQKDDKVSTSVFHDLTEVA